MATESIPSIRYQLLTDQLTRLIVPTGGKAKFTLIECERDFINAMAKIKDLVPISHDTNELELNIPYAHNITIVLTTLNF